MGKSTIALLAVLALFGCKEEKSEEEKVRESIQSMAEALVGTPEQQKEMLEKANARDQELLERKRIADRHMEILQAVKISGIAIAADNSFGTYWGDITITNGLDFALSDIGLRLKAKSPERAVAWHEGEAHLKLDGGLEPGETRQLRFNLSSFDGWRPDEYPEEAVWTGQAVSVENAAGEKVYDAYPFTSFERAMIKQIQARQE